MRRRKILITGAAGRLGSDLSVVLRKDHDLVLFDVTDHGKQDIREYGRFVKGSVENADDVARACDGVDTVIHCAAIPGNQSPFDRLVRTNVVGTINVLEEAGDNGAVEQFIYISSICVHGVLERPERAFMPHFLPFDESHPRLSCNYYGVGKSHAEHWCRVYARRFRKPVVAFRPAYILRLDKERDFVPKPAPEQPHLMDYVATSDLAEAVRLGLDYDPQSGFDVFLLHNPDQRSATPTLELLDRYFPSDVRANREKLSGCRGYAGFVDCSHARDVLGWRPNYTCKRPGL